MENTTLNAEEQLTPITPGASKATNKYPLLLIILGILVVFALGAAAFMWWQNQQLTQQMAQITNKPTEELKNKANTELLTAVADQMVGWKTYIDSKSGVSFKYPTDWSILESTVEGKPQTIFVNIENGTLDTILAKKGLSKVVFNSQEIDGRTLLRNSYKTVYGMETGLINLSADKFVFIEGYIGLDDSGQVIKDQVAQFDQILSTFRFTDPTTSSTPSLISIDDTWNLYTNQELGFSMKLPKQSQELWSGCETVDGKTYGKKDSELPVVALSKPDGIVITHEYYYQPIMSAQTDGSMGTTECEKIPLTAKFIQDQNTLRLKQPTLAVVLPQYWDIKVGTVANDTQLLAFIQKNYGQSCQIGKKTGNSNGYLDVKIEGDGKDMEETQCLVNYIYALKYSPALQKAATWGVGQGLVFYTDSGQTPYDMEIVSSFKFLP